jgi:hypothetical protein
MIRKTKYGDEPLGDVKIIPDFLPCRKELAFRAEQTKSMRGSNHGRKSKQAERAGPKRGFGACWGRKADAKRESNKVRRLNAK